MPTRSKGSEECWGRRRDRPRHHLERHAIARRETTDTFPTTAAAAANTTTVKSRVPVRGDGVWGKSDRGESVRGKSVGSDSVRRGGIQGESESVGGFRPFGWFGRGRLVARSHWLVVSLRKKEMKWGFR